MPPPDRTAASRVPSAEEVMPCQVTPDPGALVCVHVSPLLVEVWMPVVTPPFIAAARRVPSAEEAIDHQFAPGALDGVQVAPAAPELEVTKPGRLSVELVAAGRTVKPPTLP